MIRLKWPHSIIKPTAQLLVSFIVSFFSSQLLAYNFSLSSWQQIEMPGASAILIQRAAPGHMIVVVESENETRMDFESASPKEILSAVVALRTITLEQFGFHKIIFEEFSLKRNSINTELVLKGSYYRTDNKRITFYEKQLYRDKYFLQVSYMIEQGSLERTPKQIENIIFELIPAELRFRQVSSFNFIKIFGIQSAWANESVSSIVGQAKPTCSANLNYTGGLKNQVESLQTAVDARAPECRDKKGWIDPNKKSVLQDLGLKDDESNGDLIAGRMFSVCLYGAVHGVYGSMRDLVSAAGDVTSFAIHGAVNGAKNIYTGLTTVRDFDFQKWRRQFTAQAILDKTRAVLNDGLETVKVTATSIQSAFDKADAKLYSAYQQGGVIGSFAAVAQAAVSLSPHEAIGQFLKDSGMQIYHALQQEWGSFKCMSTEAQAQSLCDAAGYLATEFMTGKLALSALSKAGKMKDLVKFLISKEKQIENASTAEKAVVTTTAAAVTATAVSSTTEAFAPTSKIYSGSHSTREFVEGANSAARNPLGSKTADAIAKKIAGDKDAQTSYGAILQKLNDLEVKVSETPAGTTVSQSLKAQYEATQKLTNSLNQLLTNPLSKGPINIGVVKDIMADALAANKPEELNSLSWALDQFGKNLANSPGDVKLAVKSWEEEIKARNPNATQSDIDKTRECLIGKGVSK